MSDRYAIRTITAPPYEPLSRTVAKDHLRIDSDITAHDARVDALIVVARQWCEAFTGRALVQQTLELSLDHWSGVVELPRAPIITLDSIKYTDANGTEQTWVSTNYQADLYSEPARIGLAYAGTLPSSLRGDMNQWRVRFTAGYPVGSPNDAAGYAENIPAPLKQAMLLAIGHWFENREAVASGGMARVPLGAEYLAGAYRLSWL